MWPSYLNQIIVVCASILVSSSNHFSLLFRYILYIITAFQTCSRTVVGNNSREFQASNPFSPDCQVALSSQSRITTQLPRMAVIWGLDLHEMQWGKFKGSYMFNQVYHLRRSKMIVYQIAMILCVVSESLGTAALSGMYISTTQALPTEARQKN